MSRFRWIEHEGHRLLDIGVLDDGSVHNPNGYPDALVRAAVQAAEARVSQRLSRAAVKGAVTRRRRVERNVYAVTQGLREGRVYGPRGSCVICGKGLSDVESVERGIGSECWQRMLKVVEGQLSLT